MYSMIRKVIKKEEVTEKDFHYFITYLVAKLAGEVDE
jgi:hypothetical protein